MMGTALVWLLAAVAIADISRIAVEEEVFEGLRKRLERLPGVLGWYFGGLFSCAYCFSTYLCIGAAFVLPGQVFALWPVDLAAKAFSLHFMAFLLYEGFTRIKDRQPFFVSLVRGEPEIQVPIGGETMTENSGYHGVWKCKHCDKVIPWATDPDRKPRCPICLKTEGVVQVERESHDGRTDHEQ